MALQESGRRATFDTATLDEQERAELMLQCRSLLGPKGGGLVAPALRWKEASDPWPSGGQGVPSAGGR